MYTRFLTRTEVDKGTVTVDHEAVRETLLCHVPDRAERMMGWLTQPYYEKGKAEGRVEGKAEGKAEGGASVLTRLLEKRFGVVPRPLRERIFAADVQQIDAWVERACDSPDLEGVFEFT
jgi:hypothetical protein